MNSQAFHIASDQGALPVQGEAFDIEIGGRLARLFIHQESPLEGARLSCARSGMMIGKIAPLLLVRLISGEIEPGAPQDELNRYGARLLVDSLVKSHGAERLWRVMDRAPDIVPAMA